MVNYKSFAIGTYAATSSFVCGHIGAFMAWDDYFGKDRSIFKAIVIGGTLGPIIAPPIALFGIGKTIKDYFFADK